LRASDLEQASSSSIFLLLSVLAALTKPILHWERYHQDFHRHLQLASAKPSLQSKVRLSSREEIVFKVSTSFHKSAFIHPHDVESLGKDSMEARGVAFESATE